MKFIGFLCCDRFWHERNISAKKYHFTFGFRKLSDLFNKFTALKRYRWISFSFFFCFFFWSSSGSWSIMPLKVEFLGIFLSFFPQKNNFHFKKIKSIDWAIEENENKEKIVISKWHEMSISIENSAIQAFSIRWVWLWWKWSLLSIFSIDGAWWCQDEKQMIEIKNSIKLFFFLKNAKFLIL